MSEQAAAARLEQQQQAAAAAARTEVYCNSKPHEKRRNKCPEKDIRRGKGGERVNNIRRMRTRDFVSESGLDPSTKLRKLTDKYREGETYGRQATFLLSFCKVLAACLFVAAACYQVSLRHTLMPLRSSVPPSLLHSTSNTAATTAASVAAPAAVLHRLATDGAGPARAAAVSAAELERRAARFMRDLQRWGVPTVAGGGDGAAVTPRGSQRRGLATPRRLYSISRGRSRSSSNRVRSWPWSLDKFAWAAFLSTEECSRSPGEKIQECLQGRSSKPGSTRSSLGDKHAWMRSKIPRAHAMRMPSLLQLPPSAVPGAPAASYAVSFSQAARKSGRARPPTPATSSRRNTAFVKREEETRVSSTSRDSSSSRLPLLVSKPPFSLLGLFQSVRRSEDEEEDETAAPDRAVDKAAATKEEERFLAAAGTPTEEVATVSASEKADAKETANEWVSAWLPVEKDGRGEGKEERGSAAEDGLQLQRTWTAPGEVASLRKTDESLVRFSLKRSNPAAAAVPTEAEEEKEESPAAAVLHPGPESFDRPATNSSGGDVHLQQPSRFLLRRTEGEGGDGSSGAGRTSGSSLWRRQKGTERFSTPQQGVAARPGVRVHDKLLEQPYRRDVRQTGLHNSALPWAGQRSSEQQLEGRERNGATLQAKARRRQESAAAAAEDEQEIELIYNEELPPTPAGAADGQEAAAGAALAGREATTSGKNVQADFAGATWREDPWPTVANGPTTNASVVREAAANYVWTPLVLPAEKTPGETGEGESVQYLQEMAAPPAAYAGGLVADAGEPEAAARRDATDFMGEDETEYELPAGSLGDARFPTLTAGKGEVAEANGDSKGEGSRWREEGEKEEAWPVWTAAAEKNVSSGAVSRPQQAIQELREQLEERQLQQQKPQQGQRDTQEEEEEAQRHRKSKSQQLEDDEQLLQGLAAEASAQKQFGREQIRRLQLASWTATLKVLFFLGIAVLLTSGTFAWMLLGVSRRQQAEAVKQYINCLLLAALSGFLLGLLSFFDLYKQPHSTSLNYVPMRYTEAAPLFLSIYLLADTAAFLCKSASREKGALFDEEATARLKDSDKVTQSQTRTRDHPRPPGGSVV